MKCVLKYLKKENTKRPEPTTTLIQGAFYQSIVR